MQKLSLKIVGIYIILGCLWVLFSDTLLAAFIDDPVTLTRLQTYKGWLFIAFTALVLYWLVRRQLEQLHKSKTEIEQSRQELAVTYQTLMAAEEKLRRHNEYLSALHETSLALMNRLDLNDLLMTVVIRAARLAGAEHGYICLVDEAEGCLELKIGTGNYCKDIGFRQQPGEGIAGKVWQSGSPMTVCDAVSWMERSPDYSHPLAHSIAAFPLKQASRVTGVLGLAYAGTDRCFSAEDIILLGGFAEIASMALENARLYTAIQQELDERQRNAEMIKHLAYHDALTGLPNRVLFTDRLALALAHAHHNNELLAVLFLDLDAFKTINDSLGHVIGDKLLKSVAERLLCCVREGDTVARPGGDEFMILLPDIQAIENAVTIAWKIMDKCRQPWTFGEHELILTASIGIAIYPNDGQDVETLMKNADTAMYRSKESGRNTCQLYTAGMNDKALEKLRLESRLRYALDRNQLALYYQPQVSVQSGRIVGFEALIRWIHPELGIIPPAEFIPLAEQTGLIAAIGEWVLYTACSQAAAWQQPGCPPLRVSVNLSARQFQQENLAGAVAAALRSTGLEPSLLELEITESIAMQDVNFTAATLSALKEMGVRIAVDDFGTGYSSLAYLKRFPIDTLKIDRSFIAELDTEPDDAAIVTTIIALAENLGLNVIAEGVETQSQLAFLRQHNCHEMQGYYFSRPLPASEINFSMLNSVYLK